MEESAVPLLRRPFSIFSVEGEIVSIIFNVVGLGTRLLSQKKAGETLDVLGPLGNGVFPFSDEKYDTALLVAGGLGVAAFPFLNSRLACLEKCHFLSWRKNIVFGRTERTGQYPRRDRRWERRVPWKCCRSAEKFMDENPVLHPRIYSCGPMPMMRALAKYSREKHIPCYAALECEMACGIGLCQGCPVETAGDGRKYKLVCKDGPVFEVQDILF